MDQRPKTLRRKQVGMRGDHLLDTRFPPDMMSKLGQWQHKHTDVTEPYTL